MKKSLISVAITAVLLLTACGSEAQPLPDIEATVEARLELARAFETAEALLSTPTAIPLVKPTTAVPLKAESTQQPVSQVPSPTGNKNLEEIINRATIHYFKKEFEEAIKLYTEVLDSKPDYGFGFRMRGQVYYNQGLQIDKAIEDYNKAIKLGESDSALYAELGTSYYDLGMYEESAETYTEAIELYPDEPYFYSARDMALAMVEVIPTPTNMAVYDNCPTDQRGWFDSGETGLYGPHVDIYKDDLTVWLDFVDASSYTAVTLCGSGTLKIFSDHGEQLYSGSFQIDDEDSYVDSSYGLAFPIRIPLNEIPKSYSDSGFVSVDFSDKNSGLIFEDMRAEAWGVLPVFTVKETAEMDVENYLSKATLVSEQIKGGVFDITLTSYGEFITTDILGLCSQGISSCRNFRMNFTVTNVSSEPSAFKPKDIAILDDNGNQFSYAMFETLMGYNADDSQIQEASESIHPGVTVERRLLFEVLPRGNLYRAVFYEGSWSDQTKYEYEFRY